MCCDGTLFAIVRLAGDEPARMRSRGLPVIAREDGDVMPQRCAALAGLDCAIYVDRPAQCAGFECLLAKALGDHEVSLDEALAVVVAARSASDAPEYLRRHFLGRAAPK